MKELHRKGLAIHSDPESCICNRKGAGEALTGENAGQPLSCEIQTTREPTLLSEAEGNTLFDVNSESKRVSAQSETLSTHGHSLHGNREILEISGENKKPDRLEKVTNHTSNMHIPRKSDSCVVPEKKLNKDDYRSAEVLEGRQLTKENAKPTAEARTQSRNATLTGLQRVREIAHKDKDAKFTALLHHITIDLLKDSCLALKRQAAPGIDGVTWKDYEKNLEKHLPDLHTRIHRGAYCQATSESAPRATLK